MATSIRLAPEVAKLLDFLAAEVLERARKEQEQVHSAADVRKDLGLDD